MVILMCKCVSLKRNKNIQIRSILRLTKVVNQLDKGDQNNLSLCGDFFVKHKQYFMAAEVYKKIGDVKNLVSIFIKSCQWDEALKLVEEHPDLKPNFYVKYATWLAENDQFVEAQKGKSNYQILIMF